MMSRALLYGTSKGLRKTIERHRLNQFLPAIVLHVVVERREAISKPIHGWT